MHLHFFILLKQYLFIFNFYKIIKNIKSKLRFTYNLFDIYIFLIFIRKLVFPLATNIFEVS